MRKLKGLLLVGFLFAGFTSFANDTDTTQFNGGSEFIETVQDAAEPILEAIKDDSFLNPSWSR